MKVGALVKLSELSLPEFRFFAAHVPGHAREPDIVAFSDWVAGQARDYKHAPGVVHPSTTQRFSPASPATPPSTPAAG